MLTYTDIPGVLDVFQVGSASSYDVQNTRSLDFVIDSILGVFIGTAVNAEVTITYTGLYFAFSPVFYAQQEGGAGLPVGFAAVAPGLVLHNSEKITIHTNALVTGASGLVYGHWRVPS